MCEFCGPECDSVFRPATTHSRLPDGQAFGEEDHDAQISEAQNVFGSIVEKRHGLWVDEVGPDEPDPKGENAGPAEPDEHAGPANAHDHKKRQPVVPILLPPLFPVPLWNWPNGGGAGQPKTPPASSYPGDQPEIVTLKQWYAFHDACDDCVANMQVGAIPVHQAFPSGDMHPPAHPHCRCHMQTGPTHPFITQVMP